MKCFMFAAAALLLLCGNVVLCGPSTTEKAPPAWKVEPYKFPIEGKTLNRICRHGSGLLAVAGDTEGDTLWYLDGDKPAEVKDAAGNQVSADFLYTELTGDVTVVSATRFDTETTQFYLVADGKAELIVDPKGKPAAGKFYFSSEAGIPLVRGRD